MYKTYTKCLACDGSGVYTTTGEDEQGNPIEVIQDPCEVCEGDGYKEISGAVDGELEMKKLQTDMDWVVKKIKKILVELGLPED